MKKRSVVATWGTKSFCLVPLVLYYVGFAIVICKGTWFVFSGFLWSCNLFNRLAVLVIALFTGLIALMIRVLTVMITSLLTVFGTRSFLPF